MPRFGPISRRELVARLRRLGCGGPFSVGKHEFMLRGTVSVTTPNPHRGDIGPNLLAQVLRQAGISRRESGWNTGCGPSKENLRVGLARLYWPPLALVWSPRLIFRRCSGDSRPILHGTFDFRCMDPLLWRVLFAVLRGRFIEECTRPDFFLKPSCRVLRATSEGVSPLEFCHVRLVHGGSCGYGLPQQQIAWPQI